MTPKAVVNRLRDAGVPDPQGDARRLFDWAFEGVPRDEIEGARERWDLFDAAIEKRIERQPVSQIIGCRAFWRHAFRVTPDVLDPRPETETLVELALSEPFERVLDLGTGSGCILISLLADRPKAKGAGTDISEHALRIAGENAERLGVADRLILPLSDWFDDIGSRFDLIVSNPPYIALNEMDCLAPEVKNWEPHLALTDGADGLSAYRAIACGAPRHLTEGGRLLVEVGAAQSQAVIGIFRAAGLEDVHAHPDLDGRERVVTGRLLSR